MNYRIRKKDPDFDFSTKEKIMVTGDSNSEDVDESWVRFAAKINEYKDKDFELQIDFKLDSFNSSTQRYIMSKMNELDKMAFNQPIKVNWHYAADDEDMLYFGKVYRSFCKKIKINLVKYQYDRS